MGWSLYAQATLDNPRTVLASAVVVLSLLLESTSSVAVIGRSPLRDGRGRQYVTRHTRPNRNPAYSTPAEEKAEQPGQDIRQGEPDLESAAGLSR
jgi:hypothetical protein